MKALKRLTCVLLTLSLLFGDGWITSFAGLDFAKPLTVAAATVTDCYDAYDGFIKLINSTADAASQLSLKANDNANTRVKTAGNPTSPDMSTLWKINKDKYSYGVYKGYFTYEQKNIDAAAQVKSGKWLTNTKYEAMTGTPTTEKLFFTMGGTQWIVDLQYRMVQAKYLRRYNFEARAKNYCYYEWPNPVSTGTYARWEWTTPEFRWDQNPEQITWKNAAFRHYEGYDVSLATAGDKWQESLGNSVWIYDKIVPTKDKFHTNQKIFNHDAALSNSLTPNQFLAISVKKGMYAFIESLKEGYNAQRDNYRADQGMSDPAYDDTGNFMYYTSIGWNYTYYFMVRKGNGFSNVKTSIVGDTKHATKVPDYDYTASVWLPCMVTYLYDWQSYHDNNGVNANYNSATLAPCRVSQYNLKEQLKQNMTDSYIAWGSMGYTNDASVVFPLYLGDSNLLQSLGVDLSTMLNFCYNDLMYNYRFVFEGCHDFELGNWTFFDLDYFLDHVVAYGYESTSAPMKLSPDLVGNAVETTYHTPVVGMDVDLVQNGYNPCAVIYQHMMYNLFLNFGPLFYQDELAVLFDDCPWYKPNSKWTTQRANNVLGFFFGAVTAEQFNSNCNEFSLQEFEIPVAAFPRGGDLDSSYTWGDSFGGKIESGAIAEYDESELFTLQLNEKTAYLASIRLYLALPNIEIYDYGKTYCTAEHGDGSHCISHTTSGLDCKTAHTKHSPAPSGADAHGNTYTMGCTCGTQYYTEDVDVSGCGGTCAGCEHTCPSVAEGEEDTHTCPPHTTHPHAASRDHHNIDTHYVGKGANGDFPHAESDHDTEFPLQYHVMHAYNERCTLQVNVNAIGIGSLFSKQEDMQYKEQIGQLFTNVQWLDITSYQVWMLNRGQSKGLANILASPVTVDANSEILRTAVVDQKGFTVYNIDDRDNKEPTDGLTTVTDEIKNLQARGRVANSFNNNSYGNNAYVNNFTFELANSGARSQMKACTLSFLANDSPAFKGQKLYSKAQKESNFYSGNNYTNGDVHAFMLTGTGSSGDDSLSFYYNPYSQGGRSNTSFNGFVLQALAHTLYYPALKSDKESPNPHPTRSNSYWVSYSNSLRIQGDYIGMDYLSKQATDQQTLAGYMYDTWDEKDVGESCHVSTHGHKYKLLKDSEEGYDALAKYNVRCTWVPGRFSYLMSRGPEDQIFGPGVEKIITCTNNCFMIHTFCRGINADTHTCWDSIAGDSGTSNCAVFSSTEMGTVTKEKDPNGILVASVYNPIRKGINGITLKYWDNKTPYKHIKDSFKNAQTYNHKYLYATVNDPAPYIGYAADSGGGKNGTQDITLKGSSTTQQGYRPFITNCKFDVSRTMVSSTPYKNARGIEVSFARFGVKPKSQPRRVNTDKNDRGTDAEEANTFSSKYPWLQELDLNRYLANDRYTTGSAQIEYESVAKHKDAGQNTVYAHTETNDVASKDKYYYKIPKFGGGYLTADKVIYVNAAYRRTQSVAADNFEGNPNDIVVYNPVSTQSAHVVPVSEHLPDAANVGAKVSSDGAIQRDYTETYLQSFCTYVKRDSRIAYKYDLDAANGDSGTEKVVNTKSLFLAHNVTAQEYTTEEYYDVSSAETTYSNASDHSGSVSDNPRYVISNNGSSVTILESARYSLQYFAGTTDKKSEMSTVDLRGGDVLYYPVDKNMLFLRMQTTYSMSNKELAVASNVATAALYEDTANNNAQSAISGYAQSQKASGLLTDDNIGQFLSDANSLYAQWWLAQGYLPAYASEAWQSVQEYADATTESYTSTQLQEAVSLAIDSVNALFSGKFYTDGYSGTVNLKGLNSLTVGFAESAAMRKGTVLLLTVKANEKIDTGSSKQLIAELCPADSTLASQIATYAKYIDDGKTLQVYIEAIEDDAAVDSVTFKANGIDIGINSVSLETLPTPLLSTHAVDGSVVGFSGIEYYRGGSNWGANGDALVPLKNKFLIQSSTSAFTLEGVANSFVLECEGFATAGNNVSSSVTDQPHTVISSYWKHYVLDGWLCNGSAITSSADDRLNNDATMLKAPSNQGITVGDIKFKIDNKSLLIYKTNGAYKLALASDPREWDTDSGELYIKSTFYSTTDRVDYMAFSDKDPSELTRTNDPHDLSFYQTPDIVNYYTACIYYATKADAIAYDVKYSSSQNHKYSPESPNYSQDVFVTTTTRYFFTDEAYTKIFGSYLSLDDEFTIYWDNYADLVNNADSEDTEGALSNLKLTHAVLGRGWDNRKDSQSNDDTAPAELKSSTVYSNWAQIKKNDYWANMESSSLSKVTDCTKWIYTKYVIFNVDMYAFSEDKSYVYDDTKGPNQQEGKWDPTTPAFKEDGSPNHIVYIPAGSHVQLGYYKQRSTSTKRYSTNDDNGRFIDYGYRAFYNEDGTIHTPDGEDKYTKDPNGDLYTYHFWVPLSDGESDNTVTVQYVVNAINSVEDFDADANKDHVIDDPTKCPDTNDSLGNTKAKPTLSGSSYNVKQFVTKNWTGKEGHYQTDSHSSALKRGIKDEWGNDVINASGLQILNNVLGVNNVNVKTDANGVKYFTNKTTKVYRRANNTVNSSTVSVVGSIGNFAIVDVGDPRYQDTFKLSTTPDTYENYFAYPVVKAIQKYSNVKGEEGSQDYYMTDFLDVRGRYKIADSNLSEMSGYSLSKHGGDTYSWNNAETSGSAAWYMATTSHTFSTETKVPNKHSELVNDNQSVKVGYEQICTLETIGNYFGSRSEREGSKQAVNIDNDYGQTKLQIIPMYYAINKETGEKVNVDVYMKSGKTYRCINAGSEFATKEVADAAKAEAQANGELVTEAHYYDGPYYLDNAYNNAYTYGLTTNTAGDDGNTYKLDQHMLRYSITAKEAEVTYDVVKRLAASKNNVAVKNGIKNTILDYYDYSDKTTIGGDALDATYAYGNAQIMYLREYNRTFVGGTTAALNEKLPTTAFTKALIRNAGMYAQKWYFGIKLPSSTVFVRHGEILTYHKVVQNGNTYTMASTDLSSEEGWTIYCRILIFAIGDKYVLISHSKPSIDPNPTNPPPPDDHTPDPSNYLTTITIDLDKGKSTIDLEGRGSH